MVYQHFESVGKWAHVVVAALLVLWCIRFFHFTPPLILPLLSHEI